MQPLLVKQAATQFTPANNSILTITFFNAIVTFYKSPFFIIQKTIKFYCQNFIFLKDRIAIIMWAAIKSSKMISFIIIRKGLV